MKNIKVIAFDADDTLWVNEPFFRSAEAQYFQILEKYIEKKDFTAELYENEIKNLKIFGYGAKGFMLSMIETGLELTNYQLKGIDIQRMINLGKEILTYKINIYPTVVETLKALEGKYRIICITKGDLLDQESKVARSGLGDFFEEVNVVSEKVPQTYNEIISKLEITPQEFLMVGNSLKSDILPNIDIGAHAIYIPQKDTWVHETINEDELQHKGYLECKEMVEILGLLGL